MNGKLQAEDNALSRMFELYEKDGEIIDAAYVRTLGRHPTEFETQRIVSAFGEYEFEQRRGLFEDLLWSLMSSREFLFNH